MVNIGSKSKNVGADALISEGYIDHIVSLEKDRRFTLSRIALLALPQFTLFDICHHTAAVVTGVPIALSLSAARWVRISSADYSENHLSKLAWRVLRVLSLLGALVGDVVLIGSGAFLIKPTWVANVHQKLGLRSSWEAPPIAKKFPSYFTESPTKKMGILAASLSLVALSATAFYQMRGVERSTSPTILAKIAPSADSSTEATPLFYAGLLSCALIAFKYYKNSTNTSDNSTEKVVTGEAGTLHAANLNSKNGVETGNRQSVNPQRGSSLSPEPKNRSKEETEGGDKAPEAGTDKDGQIVEPPIEKDKEEVNNTTQQGSGLITPPKLVANPRAERLRRSLRGAQRLDRMAAQNSKI